MIGLSERGDSTRLLEAQHDSGRMTDDDYCNQALHSKPIPVESKSVVRDVTPIIALRYR
jgi:hypothetical protein